MKEGRSGSAFFPGLFSRRMIMASSKEYLDFILEQLSGVDGITHKQMMGEYILYMNGRIIGGIYEVLHGKLGTAEREEGRAR